MIKGVRIFLFSLSLFFLGAHTFVPHNHVTTQLFRHVSFPSWLDFLVDIVAFDLGQQHLEEYLPICSSCDSPKLESTEFYQPYQNELLPTQLTFNEESTCFAENNLILNKSLFFESFSLRGPPQAA